MSKDNLYGVNVVRALTGLSRDTIRHAADRGKLPSVRTPSGHRRFRLEDIESFAQSLPDQPHPKARKPAPPPVDPVQLRAAIREVLEADCRVRIMFDVAQPVIVTEPTIRPADSTEGPEVALVIEDPQGDQ